MPQKKRLRFFEVGPALKSTTSEDNSNSINSVTKGSTDGFKEETGFYTGLETVVDKLGDSAYQQLLTKSKLNVSKAINI